METGQNLEKSLEKVFCEIPIKLPSLNEYIRDCRSNQYVGAKMKKRVENDIMLFINRLPVFNEPIYIAFHWIEENKRRDLDNVAFAKKFILDAMVKAGKLKDDNRRFVTGFSDDFSYDKNAGVILEIMLAKDR